MALIRGTLTVADSSIGVDQWDVRASICATGELVGSDSVMAAGGQAREYGILTESHLPCYVTGVPHIDGFWSATKSTVVGEIRIPNNPELLYLFKVISAPIQTEDAYWDDTVLIVMLDLSSGDPADMKGHYHSIYYGSFQQAYPGQQFYAYGGYFILTNYYDSSTGLITYSSPDFNLGTDDFTLEGWFYFYGGGYGNRDIQMFAVGDPTSAGGLGIFMNDTNGLQVIANNIRLYNEGAAGAAKYSWAYIALVRESGTLSIYVGGILKGTAALSGDVFGDVAFGTQRVNDLYFQNRFATFRMTKMARYSGPFTPNQEVYPSFRPSITGESEPEWVTTPGTTQIDAEVTWMCMGRTVKPVAQGWLLPSSPIPAPDPLSSYVKLILSYDSEIDLRTWLNPNTTLDAFVQDRPVGFSLATETTPPSGGYGCAKFEPELAGGYNYYKGIDYLTNNRDTAIGTGDFTLEFWMRPGASPEDFYALFDYGHSYYYNTAFMVLYKPQSGRIAMLDYYEAEICQAPITAAEDGSREWTHVALSRQSGVVRIFVDGVAGPDATITKELYAYEGSANDNDRFWVGRDVNYRMFAFEGYLADFRLTVGVARYWSNFTRPANRFVTYL